MYEFDPMADKLVFGLLINSGGSAGTTMLYIQVRCRRKNIAVQEVDSETLHVEKWDSPYHLCLYYASFTESRLQ